MCSLPTHGRVPPPAVAVPPATPNQAGGTAGHWLAGYKPCYYPPPRASGLAPLACHLGHQHLPVPRCRSVLQAPAEGTGQAPPSPVCAFKCDDMCAVCINTVVLKDESNKPTGFKQVTVDAQGCAGPSETLGWICCKGASDDGNMYDQACTLKQSGCVGRDDAPIAPDKYEFGKQKCDGFQKATCECSGAPQLCSTCGAHVFLLGGIPAQQAGVAARAAWAQLALHFLYAWLQCRPAHNPTSAHPFQNQEICQLPCNPAVVVPLNSTWLSIQVHDGRANGDEAVFGFTLRIVQLPAAGQMVLPCACAAQPALTLPAPALLTHSLNSISSTLPPLQATSTAQKMTAVVAAEAAARARGSATGKLVRSALCAMPWSVLATRFHASAAAALTPRNLLLSCG